MKNKKTSSEKFRVSHNNGFEDISSYSSDNSIADPAGKNDIHRAGKKADKRSSKRGHAVDHDHFEG